MNKKLWTVLIIGIILRIILAVSTFHPDSLAFDLGGKLIASGKILNLYDFSDPNIAVLNYPPAIYWFHGIFHLLLANFLPAMLVVKLPYLLFDIGIAFILWKLFPNLKQGNLAFTLWMFNPLSLYAGFMMGQFDVIPTFFTVLSIYYLSKGKLSAGALALGGGIAFKIYPIFLLIPLLILGKNYFERLKLFLLGIVPYALSILIYLPSHSFRSLALFAAQSSKSLYAAIPVSGGESILLFPLALLVFYLILWQRTVSINSFWKVYSIPLFFFFIFTHYHPQWLIWITPFLIIGLVTQWKVTILPTIIIFLSWFASLFFFDPSLTLGIFSPVIAGSQNALSIWRYLRLNPDYNSSRSVIQTMFAGGLVYLIYEYFPRSSNE